MPAASASLSRRLLPGLEIELELELGWDERGPGKVPALELGLEIGRRELGLG